MARFNTGAKTLTVSGSTILTYAFTGGIISLTGTAGYGLTLATPVSFPGLTQNVYNATSGDCTILTAAGSLKGNGFTTNTQQTIPSGAWFTIVSNGTDYVISNNEGGPLVATSGSITSTLAVTTSVTSPTMQGSTSSSATLTLRSTSNATKATAGILMDENVASTTKTTGTLVVTGGLGVGGRINATDYTGTVGANSTSAGSFTTVTAGTSITNSALTANRVVYSTTAGLQTDSANLTFNGTTLTANTIGAFTLSGTISGGGNAVENVNIGASTRGTGAFTTLAANNTVTLSANSSASNTTTGTLRVTGGTGITENLYVGGIFRVNDGTASNATNTGCAVFSGGIGIAGQMTATTIVETSSIAFKENVNPIEDALNKVMQLVGVTYDRKDMDKHEAGLIAEEVNKVIPELVSKDADGNPHGIQYSKLTAYLIEAVKSLKNEIDTLKGNNR
jgi:hypothetical protein